nr:hypothetical protein [Pandoravirus aubagnensis]
MQKKKHKRLLASFPKPFFLFDQLFFFLSPFGVPRWGGQSTKSPNKKRKKGFVPFFMFWLLWYDGAHCWHTTNKKRAEIKVDGTCLSLLKRQPGASGSKGAHVVKKKICLSSRDAMRLEQRRKKRKLWGAHRAVSFFLSLFLELSSRIGARSPFPRHPTAATAKRRVDTLALVIYRVGSKEDNPFSIFFWKCRQLGRAALCVAKECRLRKDQS